MAGRISSAKIVLLEELNSSSSSSSSSALLRDGASLRVTGRLQEYSVNTAVAVIADGNATLKVDTQNLRDIHLGTGSLYQFIGELLFQPGSSPDQAILQARIGRNVDGINLELFRKALELRRKFENQYMNQHPS